MGGMEGSFEGLIDRLASAKTTTVSDRYIDGVQRVYSSR